ncbi:MAG TPA: RNA polymerase sigma factor [Bryobacteraceae bacterium]|nr:RNA polymerase sigma factor [Bryobacteraceae bacterium]
MAEHFSPDQFSEFYAATGPALRSYVCRVCGDSTLADDILQESYIRMLNAPPIPEEKRKAYLYRTATNLIVDHQRTVQRQRRWWQWLAKEEPAIEAGLDVKSDMQALFSLLRTQERALLWLAYVEGEGHREIADVLHVGEKSVRVLLHRARRKMESILREHGYEAGHE